MRNKDKLDFINQIVKETEKQRELLGCAHNQIRIDGKDVGTCVKCGVKMEKAWQPNCG
jgi:DNA-binding MarR family transcriptional regulator